ncbi:MULTISPECIES: hypothetical protein [Paraburkholderia]|uniref:Uncharacterized protein n=1 Tax=Paraburkholderia terrae TaxID=311230 RepID=A0ABM7TTE3_9BURK|nr:MULTISPECIES: hypothetical protein [Paraburkholderia]BCZ81698.1 hypothetical protein PTKU64_53730 [Paraburkholderia terrae]SKC68919.1 hypothetical protein SAMN05446934_1823 [Paraburkholderia hospita]
MQIAELMDFLRNADPSATVMFVPHGEREQDAQEVELVSPSRVEWTRESGIDKGRPYEFLYPGAPHRDLRAGCEQVTYERVSVVLLKAV